jgi:hypothetical protein
VKLKAGLNFKKKGRFPENFEKLFARLVLGEGMSK